MDVAVLVSPAAGRGRARASSAGVLAALPAAAGFAPRVLPATTGADAERQAAEAVAGGVGGGGGRRRRRLGTRGAAGRRRDGDAAGGGPRRHRQRPGAGPGRPRATAVAAARAAAEDLARRPARAVDAGRTGDRWWATVLCCGFDSAVSDRANRLRWPRGPAALRRRRPGRAGPAAAARGATLVLDGEAHTLPVTLVAVGNTAWYGGGDAGLPGRRPDGRALRRHRRRADQPPRAGAHPPAADRRHARRARRRHGAPGARVELASPGVTTYADGEPVAPLPATAECVPGALHVVGTARL